jgi:hypothetical protein
MEPHRKRALSYRISQRIEEKITRTTIIIMVFKIGDADAFLPFPRKYLGLSIWGQG